MKRFFLRGLGALLPLVMTIWIFYLVFTFLFDYIGTPIGYALHWILESLKLAKPLREEEVLTWHFSAAGFSIALILIFVAGFFMATFLGKGMVRLMESVVKRLPIIRVVYPYAKQFTEFLFSSEEQAKMEFKSPVALPFPTQGMYSIGFVTSEGLRHLNEVTKKHNVCVFVPTSPTPFTGFIVYVPREDIIPLPISVDDAMRLFISAGVLAPAHQAVHMSDIQSGPHPPMPGTPGA